MEKLADIGAFESLSGSSSAVFNGSWNYHPVTVKDALWYCKKIRNYADTLVALLAVDGIEDKKRGLCLYQLDPATVLMVHETARDLDRFAKEFCEDAAAAADASERKHFRNKIVEKYPDVDLGDIHSAFMDALDDRNAEEYTRLRTWSSSDEALPPELRRWRDYYRRVNSSVD